VAQLGITWELIHSRYLFGDQMVSLQEAARAERLILQNFSFAARELKIGAGKTHSLLSSIGTGLACKLVQRLDWMASGARYSICGLGANDHGLRGPI